MTREKRGRLAVLRTVTFQQALIRAQGRSVFNRQQTKPYGGEILL